METQRRLVHEHIVKPLALTRLLMTTTTTTMMTIWSRGRGITAAATADGWSWRWVAWGALGTSLAVGGLWLWLSKRRRSETRLRVGTVSALALFPVKSCRPLALTEATCGPRGMSLGPVSDRHWLVVTEESGAQVTARQEPRLVLVEVSWDSAAAGLLRFTAPGVAAALAVPISLPPTNPVRTCRVFGMDVPGRDCGDEAAAWFTAFLASAVPLRLVHFEDGMEPRQLLRMSAPCIPLIAHTPADKVAYSDYSPYMLMTEASMEDLHAKLEKKNVSLRNFRPNIVVSDCAAFDEDSWERLEIGTVRLRKLKRCDRCVLTTVDPDTGVKDGKEPLETLRSYRLCEPTEKHVWGTAPFFGVNFTIERLGVMHVGDPVFRVLR
ncbi:unnamed protein product [Lampetra fluviatilis]